MKGPRGGKSTQKSEYVERHSRTNSHIRSHRVMIRSYEVLSLVSKRALKSVNCFSTSCGCTFASASRRVMCATTSGDGEGVGLFRENIEPRLKVRELGGTKSRGESCERNK